MRENIQIDGDTMRVVFERFDLPGYELFLKTKLLPEHEIEYDWQADSYTVVAPSRFAPLLGLDPSQGERETQPLAGHLFDYQAFITAVALKARRYAVWADTGLGKTAIFLEWARQVAARTGGRVVIVSPLNIIGQTLEEAEKFYGAGVLPIDTLHTRAELTAWCRRSGSGIGMVNYEKFIPRDGQPEVLSELRYLAGLALDESSILKSGGGKIKWSIIKSARGIPYKLSCTATPAPNDTMEYASQASFLEKLRDEGEILWTYFRRDKFGNWQVKEHAKAAFYQFMAGWSIYLRNPAHYGFADNLKDLPAPEFYEHRVPITAEQRRLYPMLAEEDGQLQMFNSNAVVGMVQRSRMAQAARGFLYGESRLALQPVESNKPRVVADLVEADVAAGLQVLVWTVFDEESSIIARMLKERGIVFDCLTGKVAVRNRQPMIERFRHGESRVLISRASMLGYGMNFQHCGSMVFSGLDDSYERFYQAVRRAYRYGQTRPVRVHIPLVEELEGVMWRNVKAKEERFEQDTRIMEDNYRVAMAELLPGRLERAS